MFEMFHLLQIIHKTASKKYENFKQNASKGIRKSNKSFIYQERHTFGTTTRFFIPKNGKF